MLKGIVTVTFKGFTDSLHKSVKLRECSNFAVLLSSAGIMNRNPILLFTKKKKVYQTVN